jgi:hypothetical protein
MTSMTRMMRQLQSERKYDHQKPDLSAANKSLQIVQAIINTAGGIMGQLNVPQDQLTGANWIRQLYCYNWSYTNCHYFCSRV